jgi:hypothetical protein
MDLQRMLERCRREQWKAEELDWTVPPRQFSPEHEMAIVQYFTDMAGIELLAGELFKVQRERTDDPVLREIFGTFIQDEIRHSRVAGRLAAHYDIHHYRRYEQNPHLVRFARHFVAACSYLSPEIANVYITTGELMLDIALLRSLNDFVSDEMSNRAMVLINRDESRHIAIDFYMVEYYSSEEYVAKLEARGPKPLPARLEAAAAMGGLLYYASPFFRDVFFGPMDLVDPSGRRLREAFKRIQLLSTKPRVAQHPFSRFLLTLQALFNHPVTGRIFGKVIVRILGLDPRVIATLYTQEEARRAEKMSIEEMAEEALAAKERD